ncbi:MAG: hypothetical protein HW381_1379 [Candidatus Rokubacteria bacterium]|nr:hypothetical protein [Candidatus Rokubacteria bacterium]
MMLEVAAEETQHAARLAMKAAPEADDLATLASLNAASTVSAPPENIWMRVRPSGVTEATNSRKRARASVVKLPKVSFSICFLSAST